MRKILPKWLTLSLLFIFLIIIALILANVPQENPTTYQFFTGSQNQKRQQDQIKNPQLEKIVSVDIPKLQGNWAVVIRDLKTAKNYTYNENEVIPAASLYKLTTMWAVFDAIENGQLKLEDPIADMTVEEALRLMIEISDNDAAIALSEKIGWGKIHRLMETYGIDGFDLVRENGPYTTAKATADLLERIWRKTAVSSAASQEMQELLFGQKLNDRIPKYLESTAKVAHKTGEIDNFRHDAGIVIGQRSHYIFVFLSETANPQEAAENIAQLSKKIYEALEER